MVGAMRNAAALTLLAALTAFAAPAAPAHAQPGGATAPTSPAIRSIAVLMDPTGQKTLTEVQAAREWQPERSTVVRGFTSSTMWLCLEVGPQVEGNTWFLRVRPSYLDDVRAYLPAANGLWEERLSGDTTPASAHETSDPVIAFVWASPAPLPSPYIYLRVHTTSIMAVNVSLLDLQQYDRARDEHHLVTGALAGLMVAVMGWALFHAIGGRNLLFALYSAYLISSLAFSMGLLGYVGRYVAPDSTVADAFTSAMGIVATLAATLFHRAFLRSFGVRMALLWLLEAGAAVTLANLALMAAGHTRLALAGNTYLVLAFTALLLPAVVVALWRRVGRHDRQLLAMYSVVPASIAITLLPMLGLLPPGAWSPYTGSIFGLITAVAVAAVLAVRQRRNEEAVQLSIAQTAAAQAEAATVRAERDDKDRFLGMLAHELRTPLSVIRMVLDMGADGSASAAHAHNPQPQHNQKMTAHARQAIEDINSVIERAVQADHLERGDVAPQRATCSVPEIVGLVVHNHLQGARVVQQAAPDLAPIESDPVLLRTMLSNLVDNALKYSPPDSPVTVHISNSTQAQAHAQTLVQTPPSPGHGRLGVAVQVRNAVGKAGAPDAQRVFAKYYRSEGAQRVGGSGLGLYLIAGLARMVGGSVTLRADSPPDEVVFELWLPA
jgi:signal transduction histidine kinase